ncbi:hypothetical protein BAURA63_03177 [Brevibacterium aurantiacum]|uniref:PI3K/PI4K catalytic domain-containing protein n=2 Tax=Brevibacterium aurantiacum TaxID=273384 RepID=A0A2H1KC36_BREAU|nr:hypothetical protein BAURA63_03177 [Brevibacterium aurantiacum]
MHSIQAAPSLLIPCHISSPSCQIALFSTAYIHARGERMCDSKRRCPGCESPSAKARHNWRRRQNRGIRKELQFWVNESDNIPDPNVREFVQHLPPGRAKEWAQNAGAPTWIANPDNTDPKRPMDAGRRPPARAMDPNHPQARAAIATALSMQGRSGCGPEERRLLTSKIVSFDHYGGGINETYKVEFTDGGEGFYKPLVGQDVYTEIALGHEYSMQAQHEIGTWKVAQKMGETYTEMVPPTVLREINGELGTLSKEYPGQALNRIAGDYEYVDPRQAHAAAVFDAATGQRDRHPANTLVYDRGPENIGITLIDHGYSFTKIGENPHNLSIWRKYQQGNYVGDSSLTEDHIADLTRLRDTNLDFLRGIVHPDRINDRLIQIGYMLEKQEIPQLPTNGGYR